MIKFLKKKIAFMLTLTSTCTLLPSMINAQTLSVSNYETKIISEMNKNDLIFQEVTKQWQKEKNNLKQINGIHNNIMSENNYNRVIIEGENKLKKNNFKLYKVNSNNKDQLEKELEMDFDSFFRADVDTNIPNNFTICIPDNSVVQPLTNSNYLASSEFDDYDWRFKTVYVYASDDPAMTKTDEADIYNKYSGWPYNDTMKEILNRTFNLTVGMATEHVWKALTIWGIDLNSIGTSPSEAFEINATAAWSRKYIQVRDASSGRWLNSVCTEYTNWDTYEDLYYYNTYMNRMIRETNHESGTTYAEYWDDNLWLIQKAKIGFWNSYIVWDITGDHEVEYDGDVVIRLRENF